MVRVQVRDQDGIEVPLDFGRRGHAVPAKVADPPAEYRIGEDAQAADLDEDGRVPDVGDPHSLTVQRPGEPVRHNGWMEATEAERGDQGREKDESEGFSFDLMEEIGGPQGIADSSIPAIVFVAAYTLGGNRIGFAGLCAVGAGVVIAILRLVKGESLRFALAGFVGVAIAAFLSKRTGRAEDFFLPGLLLNAGYAAAYMVSIFVRWPLLGIILGPAQGQGMAWRKDPAALRAYSRASWIWVGVFGTRLAVQLPFYLAGSVVALGVAKTVMGLPVFALGVWLSYLLLKRYGFDPLAKSRESKAAREAAEGTS